jgi:hypothetical protein
MMPREAREAVQGCQMVSFQTKNPNCDRCYDLKIFSTKNFAKKSAFFTQNKAKF